MECDAARFNTDGFPLQLDECSSSENGQSLTFALAIVPFLQRSDSLSGIDWLPVVGTFAFHRTVVHVSSVIVVEEVILVVRVYPTTGVDSVAVAGSGNRAISGHVVHGRGPRVGREGRSAAVGKGSYHTFSGRFPLWDNRMIRILGVVRIGADRRTGRPDRGSCRVTRTAGRFVHLAVVLVVTVPLARPFPGFLLMQIILVVNAARGRSYPFPKAGLTALHEPELLLLLLLLSFVVLLQRSIVGGIVHVSVIRLVVMVVIIIIIVISGYHRNFFVVAGVGF